MLHQTKPFKDYYSILNVSQSSSSEEIKKSFRKLALELHPDHNRDDLESEEKFKEITEAYGVLNDPSKKNEYDRFRSDHLAGHTGSSGFRYSQEDIFASMFHSGNAREIFEEINREFEHSGFRSGNTFFRTLFFGNAVGGLGRILRIVPGPIGKIGMGLKLAQVVGSSLYVLHKMKQKKHAQSKSASSVPPETKRPLLEGMKGIFERKEPRKSSLDMDFQLSILPDEALAGSHKKISYRVNEKIEQLMVHIPPNFRSGGKLRVRSKGKIQNEKRGDLILSIHVDPGAVTSKE